MTKFNKVGKSTFVIAILSFLLVAVLAFGGTYAYFSAKAEGFSGSITMGKLYVDLTNASGSTIELGEITLAQPNQRILNCTGEDAYVVNLTKKVDADTTLASTIPAYIRVKVTAELTSLDLNDKGDAYEDNDQDDSHITPANIFTVTAGDGWYQHTDGYTYHVATKTDKADTSILKSETDSVKLPLTIDVNKEVGKGGSTFFMGATGTYTITVEAIQAQYIDNNLTADKSFSVAAIADIWDDIVNNTNDYANA